MQLDIKTNYNVILFGFVDSLSKWDLFVSDHIKIYFEKNYISRKKDMGILNDYAKERKKIGWDKEIELFNWAFEGFKKQEPFSKLIATQEYIENSVNNKGVTLKTELIEKEKILQKDVLLIKKYFEKNDFKDKTLPFFKLFDQEKKINKHLPCYITYSPDKNHTQGGANGDGIYTEISTDLEENDRVLESIKTIIHEYVHKAINPSKNFINLKDTSIYKEKFLNIYPDYFYHFVEEVLTHSIVDVIIFHENPADNSSYYYKKDKHLYLLWEAVKNISTILTEYIDNKDKEITLKKLNYYFINFAKEYK